MQTRQKPMTPEEKVLRSLSACVLFSFGTLVLFDHLLRFCRFVSNIPDPSWLAAPLTWAATWSPLAPLPTSKLKYSLASFTPLQTTRPAGRVLLGCRRERGWHRQSSSPASRSPERGGAPPVYLRVHRELFGILLLIFSRF